MSSGCWCRRVGTPHKGIAWASSPRQFSIEQQREIVTSNYPIYILDFDDMVVFPQEKIDLPHSEFWKKNIAPFIADRFRIPIQPLLNLPYCQRRARISSKGLVFYGEKQSQKLLRTISKATGESDLRWVYDEHEARLSFDVMEYRKLLPITPS